MKYGLTVGLIAVVISLAVTPLETNLDGVFGTVASSV